MENAKEEFEHLNRIAYYLLSHALERKTKASSSKTKEPTYRLKH